MTEVNDSVYPHNDGDAKPEYGLTKRELFAAMAMHGYIASFAGGASVAIPKMTGKKAVEYADELIKALNTPPTP